MKIKKILSQSRRDLIVIYECDHDDCNYTEKGSGYDDSNFHQNVVPDMECKKCGRKAKPETRKMAPLYSDHVII